MPYLASIGTHLLCRVGVRPARRRLVAAIDGCDNRQGDRYEAQISLVHNVFRPRAVSALTTWKGATYGAW